MATRREFVLSTAAASVFGDSAIVVDPRPLFEISPLLHMQFMEPLGVTDSSVEAAWDYEKDDWRSDFVAATEDLGPQVLRWGGLYSRYYKWREGVGPADKRPWMRNYMWGGKETNRVGTHEFADLCRRAGAEPLMCVNFLGDGEERYRKTREGDRTGDAREAADWVSYANDPGNKERHAHGVKEPYGIKLWQLGNETSYGNTTFNKTQSIAHTIEFAKAMKERDKSIQLIGWGDRGSEGLWAGDLVKQAGEWIDYAAIHMMGQGPSRPDTVLKGRLYEKNPEQAWAELLELADRVEKRVQEIEQAAGPNMPLAITEGHLSLPWGNSNPILLEWLTAAYHARSLNIYQRHGARVKIATAADFEGNRWTVNAMLLQTPRGKSYLTPVGSIMRLFRRYNGKRGISVKSAPSGLDIAASRTDGRVFLHVANLEYSRSIEASFTVEGLALTGGRVFEIAPQDLRQTVTLEQTTVFNPVEKAIPPGPSLRWRFPAGSVSVVELETRSI